jgi:hypothetical protein
MAHPFRTAEGTRPQRTSDESHRSGSIDRYQQTGDAPSAAAGNGRQNGPTACRSWGWGWGNSAGQWCGRPIWLRQRSFHLDCLAWPRSPDGRPAERSRSAFGHVHRSRPVESRVRAGRKHRTPLVLASQCLRQAPAGPQPAIVNQPTRSPNASRSAPDWVASANAADRLAAGTLNDGHYGVLPHHRYSVTEPRSRSTRGSVSLVHHHPTGWCHCSSIRPHRPRDQSLAKRV